MNALEAGVYVSPQILPTDIERLMAGGVATIINNRPDGEKPGQPTGAEIEIACREAGLAYFHIPMGRQLTLDNIEASRAVFDKAGKDVLAFCASGNRSTILWCFARVDERGVEGVLSAAKDAGYHLEHLRPALASYLDQVRDS